MDAHDTAVDEIAIAVRTFYDRQEPFRIYHGSTNSTRPSQYRRNNIIDTSGLTNVLAVDETNRTVLVEPNVPMDALVVATLLHGLIPPVVMEFPGITAGGGFSGTSGESSSFRYGFFDRTVNYIEIVLPNGEKAKASRTERSDLFWGTASSFGTMGVITALEIQLVQAKKYVELRYYRCDSMREALEKFEGLIEDETTEYLDGIVLRKDWVVVCFGRLTDTVADGVPIRRFTRRADPWFYLQAQKLTKTPMSKIPVEAVPIVDYLFRYNRGGFWVGKYAFRYFLTPFDRLSRFLVDKYMHTRVMYHAMHASGLSHQYIVQDVAVPFNQTSAFIDWLHINFKKYPLWICPLRLHGEEGHTSQTPIAEKIRGDGKEPEYLMNFGVWGPGPRNRKKFVQVNRALEQKVHELGGKKWLYAHAFYTEEEFWSIHDREAYDALRKKFHAEHLPSIYQKVKVDVEAEERARKVSWKKRFRHAIGSVWPVRGAYGVYKAWRGGDYLLPKA
jgi:Delta24-sterol reductase